MLNVLSTRGGEDVTKDSRAVLEQLGSGEAALQAALEAKQYRRATLLCAEQHGAAIGRVCMALLGTQSEAEEVAQETLLAAYQSFENFRAEGSVRAWLFGIARKKCLKQLEQRRRQEAKLQLVKAREPDPSAEELLQRREKAERARAALELVRPTEREALILRFEAELSFEGVAEACAVDAAAARKRVSRGLARMRVVLSQMESNPGESP